MPKPLETVPSFPVAGTADSPIQNNKVLALANGQFDLAWSEDRTGAVWYDTDVAIARFNADGSPANRGAMIGPKSPADNAESDASLAALGKLQFVAFADRDNPWTDGAIRLNFYDAGSFLSEHKFVGKSVLVDGSAGDKYAPEVVALQNGRLAVAYIDGASHSVKARVYDPGKGKFAGESVTLSATAVTQIPEATSFDLGITALDGGGFAVSWRDDAGRSRLRIADQDGAALGRDIAVGTTVDKTTVSRLGDGALAVFGNGPSGITMTRIDVATGKKSQTILLGEAGYDASAARLDDGRTMVVWTRGGDIFGRVVDEEGALDGPRFKVAAAAEDLSRPQLAVLADGRVALSYQNDGKGGIYAAILDPHEHGVSLKGTNGADHLVGTRFNDVFQTRKGNDTLSGGGGSDRLDGGAGADRMIGGKGNDTYVVDNRKDVVVEASGGGKDTVLVKGSSYRLAWGVEVEKVAGLDPKLGVNLTGNAFGQTLAGGASGSNVLDGKGGADTLWGGSKGDTFVFSTALGAGDVDHIANFGAAAARPWQGDNDGIRLHHSVFEDLAAGKLAGDAFTANKAGVALDALDRIVYETDTGKLFYDADGSGVGRGVLFAVIDNRAALTAADFFVG